MPITRSMDKEDVRYKYIYMEYYSAIKKNEILHVQQHGWTWRALCLETEVRERQILYVITYMWNLKI